MGFRAENIVTSDQTHTCNVRKVTEKDRGKGIVTPRDYTDIDGMITNVPGLVLATFLCGLRTVIFCRSATPCDWTVSFRMERHCSENRRSYDKKDGRRVRQYPKDMKVANWSIYLSGLL